ncbi:GYF domain-containing protein [Aeromonas allosaccharophila]|uniref:GYF domain-containing protein n=1 Tax=Aeromonas allosaccharophila TaxID=656 RepID=UPI003AF51DC3
MNYWWYENDGMATGPVSNNELSRLLLSSALKQDVLVWSAGIEVWRPYNDLVEDFPNILEWYEEIKDTEGGETSITPPQLPKNTIKKSPPIARETPYTPLQQKQAAPLTDFAGNNGYQKRSKRKLGVSNTAAKQREGDILPGYSKEQYDADAIEAKANMYGCLLGIAFIAALVLFTLATSYICELLAPNNKDLPSQILGISALVIITIYLARKMTAMVTGLVGTVISIAPALTMSGILLASIAYLYLGFIGISYFIGYGYATLAMVVILLFRMAPIIPIAVFFGALHGLGWHWIASLAAALPGVELFSAFGVVGLFSLLRGR